ncbi:MAG: AIR synthase-related protein [archaeon]
MSASSIIQPGGLHFFLPEEVIDKELSVIEVGPTLDPGLAMTFSNFYGLSIDEVWQIWAYLLLHRPELEGLERLMMEKPFLDPIIHQTTLNESLALKLGLPFDWVINSTYLPGTSDRDGKNTLEQTIRALGGEVQPGEVGFVARQYYLTGDLTREQVEQIATYAKIGNPELYLTNVFSREEYTRGQNLPAPILVLPPEVKVERFDVANMTLDELLELNKERSLAASAEELLQFQTMYRDEEFLAKRREVGLDHRATDVEIETWFSLRSEHCFHKEFNAKITLEDKVNDPVFQKAFEKGWLSKDPVGNYYLKKGIFETFVEEPARIIYNKLEKRGKNWIVSMFEDNSSIVLYDEDYMFCIKFETHNSPSNKEPVQGAKTGIDGVNRDTFGTGRGTFDAIANFFYYCTGNPHYKGWLPPGVIHPDPLLNGVTQGVREGGNEMQIATLGGGMTDDPRYMAKALVFAGTIGWSPVRSPDGKIDYRIKEAHIGDRVIIAGQPVGIDGIHGATQSSLHMGRDITLGHVQADDSFCQTKLRPAHLYNARAGLFEYVTDFGAVGFASAAIETARQTGGLKADLQKRPARFPGIQPWQITISETQDNMLWVAKEENEDAVFATARLHDVPATDVGELTDSGYAHLTYGDETVALIDMEKLFNKEPRKEMTAVWRGGPEQERVRPKGEYTLEESLCMVMSQPDVASKEWFFRQKDSSVKGGTIQGPLLGLKQEVEADASIQKPLDTEGKDFGAIAYALGMAPKVSDIDPYHAAQKSLIDMMGKIIAIGGALPDMDEAKWDAWAVCGNYCQPNSDRKTTLIPESGEHNLASLLREGIGVREVEEMTNVPVTSGKDSMKCSGVFDVDFVSILSNHKSEFGHRYKALPMHIKEDLNKVKHEMGIYYSADVVESVILSIMPPDVKRHVSVAERKRKLGVGTKQEREVMGLAIEIHDPDTYLASAAVKIQDYRKCVDPALKNVGDEIYVVGTTKAQLGASQYLNAAGYKEQGMSIEGGIAPQTNLEEFVQVSRALNKAMDENLVASSKYIHNGGLLTALAKSAMAGEKGAQIDVSKIYTDETDARDDELLYSETPGRFVVSVAPKDRARFEEIMAETPYSKIGKVTKADLEVKTLEGVEQKLDQDTVKEAFQKPLRFDLCDTYGRSIH